MINNKYAFERARIKKNMWYAALIVTSNQFWHLIKWHYCTFFFNMEKSNYYTWLLPVISFLFKDNSSMQKMLFCPIMFSACTHCSMHCRARAMFFQLRLLFDWMHGRDISYTSIRLYCYILLCCDTP